MTITRGQLLNNGGTHVEGSWNIVDSEGVVWTPKPSDNGNGWFDGDSSDTMNMIYIIEKKVRLSDRNPDSRSVDECWKEIARLSEYIKDCNVECGDENYPLDTRQIQIFLLKGLIDEIEKHHRKIYDTLNFIK